MVGRIQRIFNKFRWRKADKNRTYKHAEILQLEEDIVSGIEKEIRSMIEENRREAGDVTKHYFLIERNQLIDWADGYQHVLERLIGEKK